ncbi:unnamed protein product [Clonostachys rosea f. rosea IK726]|uniref:Uncharacterized protein n=1 Tax=Clonostachys rosea f. rosea IK726 TaxID=1349383 RepID=A0ACA9TR59_BIOOC|nr:unnamed protein product [Clonostachys rosea f. rosea IK726]
MAASSQFPLTNPPEEEDLPIRSASTTPTGGERSSRRSRPKVKTGCSSCKQRRIKCDEKRPACSQCIKSRRECTGYPPPPRHALPLEGVRIAPKPVAIAAEPVAPAAPKTGPIQKYVILPPRRVVRRNQARSTPEHYGAVEPSPTLYRPASGLPTNGSEPYYFEMFRVTAVSSFCGYFDSVFWNRVLQECHTEPAVCHASVALGALSKTLEQTFNNAILSRQKDPSQSEAVLQHWQMAVQQYSKACNALMFPASPVHNRVRLMATVLLASFDAFIGDHKQSIVQIQNGLGLLKKMQGGEEQKEAKDFIEPELVVMLMRQAIQAKTYDMAYHFPEPYVLRFVPEACEAYSASFFKMFPQPAANSQPLKPFTTLVEAQLAHDRILMRGMQFIESLQQAKSGPLEFFPKEWMAQGVGIQLELQNWTAAFQPLFETRDLPQTSGSERSALAVLKMAQLNSEIVFRALFCSSEIEYDAVVPMFKTIIKLGREIILEEDARAAAAELAADSEHLQQSNIDPQLGRPTSPSNCHLKPSFSVDHGIVPPLFVVATKCRDQTIRRQAIQLLRASARREGMWDSELSARIGLWIMELEEYQDPTTYQGGSFIPEERRVTLHGIDLDLRSRVADLKIGSRGMIAASQQFDPRSKSTRICW